MQAVGILNEPDVQWLDTLESDLELVGHGGRVTYEASAARRLG